MAPLAPDAPESPQNGDEWLSVALASGRLGVSERTIQRRAARGELGARTVSDEQGKRLLIRFDLPTPADKVPTPSHAQNGEAADTLGIAADKVPTANDTPADTSFAGHLLEENRFLRGVIEQLQRDGAEVRAALRKALELAPKQLPASSGAPSPVAPDSSARIERRDTRAREVGSSGHADADGPQTGGKRGEMALTLSDVADMIEAMEKEMNR